ncbi:MAG TPA: hypothetical protein V6C71_17360 [Coleofasciculaceae cyanobacterium]|jgi:hypothetical protein
MSQMNNSSNSGNFKTATLADCLANNQEIFQLIEQIFPVDSCRYYQVLPLKLVGKDLVLGMLNPDNQESLKFVNSIANVFRYNLEIQLIDLQTHQIILSIYPQSSLQPQKSEPDQNKTLIDTDFNTSNVNSNNLPRSRSIDSDPTIISQPEEFASSQPKISQGLPDLPPDLDFLKDLDLTPHSVQKASKSKADSTAILFEIPPEFLNHKASRNSDDKPTIIGANPAELLAQGTSQEDPEIACGEAPIANLIAETLGNQAQKAAASENYLPTLMPQLSWQKLLEQAFKYQTEYLSLTRYSDRGSIIAHKQELSQSQIELIPLPIFCCLIDEIKKMARLSEITAAYPKKVILERFYEQERILLRLEFMLQEEETVRIQILRNRTLQIYEQQQMDKVSEQALQLAKQLEKTLRRIQACFDSAEITNLRELQTVHSRINHQLRLLDK